MKAGGRVELARTKSLEGPCEWDASGARIGSRAQGLVHMRRAARDGAVKLELKIVAGCGSCRRLRTLDKEESKMIK